MNLPLSFPTKNYTIWDLETSGLTPGKDKILEIGWMDIRDGEVADQGSVLLKHEGFEVPELIVNITGITTELLNAEGLDPRACYRLLLEKIYHSKVPNVTHNGIRFDIPFFLAAIDCAEGLAPSASEYAAISSWIRGNAIDTAVLFKAGKLGRSRRVHETFEQWANRVMEERVYGLKYKVEVCCEELGIDKTGLTQHRALGDVTLTNEIYKKIIV